MKLLVKYIFFIIYLVAFPFVATNAENGKQECFGEILNDDSLIVSFMTCEPGTAIYALYGHSAIRIRTTGGDWVFNYGMFDFKAPNFIARFVLGKTDYYMAAYPYEDFISEYEYRGSAVIEQVLNLTKEEKEKLLHSLVKIAGYEDWTYRYNFLYDNCTTRARDQIESCVNGKIVYPCDDSVESYRQIIHRYTKGNVWSEFGQDLLLGNAADVPIGLRQKMFAPLYMEKYNAKAIIIDSMGNKRPLVASTEIHQPIMAKANGKSFPVSPLGVFGTILAITIIICIAEIKKCRIYWGYESGLMLVEGLAGCLVTILFFFSEHPTVNTNWLIMVLNPLPLLYIPIRIMRIRKHRTDYYPPITTAVILLFVIATMVISQTFSVPVYCFTLSLCLQTATSTYIQYSKRWRKSA